MSRTEATAERYQVIMNCQLLKPKIISCHLLQQPYALNLKDFLEHFNFTRTVSANKAKITHKTLNLQLLRLFRYEAN